MAFDRTDKMPCRPWKRASSREANGICQNEERAGGRIVDRRGGCILQMLPGLSGHVRLGCDYDKSCLPAPFRLLGLTLETVIYCHTLRANPVPAGYWRTSADP